MILLSILIPTLPERKHLLTKLKAELNRQMWEAGKVVEIITYPCAFSTTGAKRNVLMGAATGDYVVFFDDDDWPEPCYLKEILKGCETGADCMAINGSITTDGGDFKRWFISIHHPYESAFDASGKEIYLRYPNHITPMKRCHAAAIPFPDKTIGEDYEFATKLKEAGLLKTEHVIVPPIYQYIYKTNK